MSLNFQLDSPDRLFGNDAAEHEDAQVFLSYAVNRPEIHRFTDLARPLQVVRAYKGDGKSALLRLVEQKLKEQAAAPLVIRTTSQGLAPELESDDSDAWVRAWKKSILKRIASEIGATIQVAYTDDGIALVEESERGGFKQKSLVSLVTDRLKFAGIPERSRPELANAEPVVRRWLEQGAPVWLIVDDIDQNFRNEPRVRLKIATCFIAVSHLFTSIPEIRIRLAIRPNVWATIKQEFEALSNVEQYMVDLSWSDKSFVDILARRIEGFLRRTNQWDQLNLAVDLERRKEQLVELLFESPVHWGGEHRKRPIYVPLHTLSRHRPRWLVELCKSAAEHANSKQRGLITLDDVIKCLSAFGKRRIDDTVAEFRAQCPEIEELLVAFSGQNERYATGELVSLITNRVLQGVHPKIAGILGTPSAREIAQFLFQIGFLSARRDFPDGKYEHMTYAERPNLLRATTNVDEGVSWEIHPVFRDVLKLKDVESKSEATWRRKNPRERH